MREAMRGDPSHVSPFHRRGSRLFWGLWFAWCFWLVGCWGLVAVFGLVSTTSRST